MPTATTTQTETESLPSELRDVHEQIEDVRGQLQQLMFGVNEAAFLWRPEPNHWSISECLMHLNTTAALYISAIDRAIGAGQPASGGEELPRRGFLGRWMLNTLEPPVTRRFKAPGAFAPNEPKPLDQVVPEFIRYQDEVQQRLAAEKPQLQHAVGLKRRECAIDRVASNLSTHGAIELIAGVAVRASQITRMVDHQNQAEV